MIQFPYVVGHAGTSLCSEEEDLFHGRFDCGCQTHSHTATEGIGDGHMARIKVGTLQGKERERERERERGGSRSHDETEFHAGRPSGLTDSPDKGPIEAIIDLFIDSPPTIIRPQFRQACCILDTKC